jgi:ethanolamine utilization protein EutA
VKDVRLVGLDFGTTTSRSVAASARLSRNAVTGRHELSDVREIFRSPVILTPFTEAGLDECRLKQSLDEWLAAATSDAEEIFGGGALVTGLAAQQPNSGFLIELIRSRIPDVLVATAGDPCLEAWLAFQANAGTVSRALPDRWVINIDIGGGTANIALGKKGEVLRTGSLFVGARHIEVVPGTYQILKLSRYAEALLAELKIDSGVGDCLRAEDVRAIVDWQIDLLELGLTGNRAAFQQPLARMHEQAPFELPDGVHEPLFCLSGGVGELAYEFLRTLRLPPRTQFGDLGIDLAHRIATDARWATRLNTAAPPNAGRATVYGLLLHATQVSGSTVYLSDPALLPMRDVPIFGRVTFDSTADQIRDIFQLVRRSAAGGCVLVALDHADGLGVRTLGERLASTIQSSPFPRETPLVLLVRENVGKALGGYASQWGTLPVKLVVLDEVEPLDARFVQIGRIREQVVPISFYGMN